MSLLQIGASGLLASQKSLSTIGHNISNAETEGYSRQVVPYTPNYTFFPGTGSLGTGVSANTVNRIANNFLTSQLWDSQSKFNHSQVKTQYLKELDQRLGNDSLSLAKGFEAFFTALNASSVDPYSSAARQVVLKESQALAERFNSHASHLSTQALTVGKQLAATANQANSLLATIAGLNEKIKALSAGDQPANELLDQRDLSVRKLSELITVNVMDQKNGSINIYSQTGQVLLASHHHSTLSVSGSESHIDGYRLILNNNTSQSALDSDIGGSLGGMLHYQMNELSQARSELGRLAVVLSERVNQQLQAGQDLQGNAGAALFTDLLTPLQTYTPMDASSNAMRALRITNSGQLMASDYDLRVDNAGNYVITRRLDNEVVDSGALTGGTVDTVSFDGIEIDIDGTATDQFYHLSPLRNAAREFAVVMTNSDRLAFAATGGGTGDNRNLLQLIGLQKDNVIENNTQTLGQSYAAFVSDIAVSAAKIKTELDGNSKLLNQAEAANSAFSGVNLDEEAANLIRFQQLYSANARVISVARTTFDTLLGIF